MVVDLKKVFVYEKKKNERKGKPNKKKVEKHQLMLKKYIKKKKNSKPAPPVTWYVWTHTFSLLTLFVIVIKAVVNTVMIRAMHGPYKVQSAFVELRFHFVFIQRDHIVGSILSRWTIVVCFRWRLVPKVNTLVLHDFDKFISK